MGYRHALTSCPRRVDSVNNTNEHKFKTREELEAFYEAQLAKFRVSKWDAIKKMRKDVLDLLEAAARATLREIYTYREETTNGQSGSHTNSMMEATTFIWAGVV